MAHKDPDGWVRVLGGSRQSTLVWLHNEGLEATTEAERQAHGDRCSVGMQESIEHDSYKKVSERKHCPDQPEYIQKS